jgi:predicted RNA methylase
VSLDWWPVIQELHSLKDFDSINEIMKSKWKIVNEDISSGFDLIITNPPFGRGEHLQIVDPKILCQYKLATEAWIGDLTKDNLVKLIIKQFNDDIANFYLDIFDELGIKKVILEYKINFSELLMPNLKEFAELKEISIEGKK